MRFKIIQNSVLRVLFIEKRDPSSMFFMEYKYGKTQSIWAETTEKWDDTHPSWKTVGASPRRISKACYTDGEALLDQLRRTSIEHIFAYEKTYYRVAFPSGRVTTGFYRGTLAAGEHVISEADRGEDCAIVQERVDPGKAEQGRITRSHAEPGETKNILRLATERDVEILETRKKQEARALEKCAALVAERNYPMEVTRCEFQWDMRKITFYFRSTKRIDFRDLVKELFKYFKIRIWMSMENRGNL